MAKPFWQNFWERYGQSQMDPRTQVILGDREAARVEALRSPYQIATDPRMMTGTGPGLAQIERPQYSGARPRGNIGERAMGAAPRGEGFKNPLATGGGKKSELAELLRQKFLLELMAGTAGDPPPQPYTVQVGPASRDFVPLNMYGRGL